ncbi:hypothetical protein LCGC14_0417710 [marine sediment metagenome]|uniref:Glycosyl transferase family 1 domain-containing protein n=1 Tax=marine sediment metagenome TaxID=412755 RepID=A0A0F9SRT9_9ZZZZ
MQVTILSDRPDGLGGGWSWANNFSDGIKGYEPSEDIFIIPSASMVGRDEVEKIKGKGKIVLRVDNWLKDSRNRGTGMTRMKDYARLADVVVYQSQWAMDFISPYLPKKEHEYVVLNGSDPEKFRPGGNMFEKRGKNDRCLYVRQNRDDSKQPHMAFYEYQQIRNESLEKNIEMELWIVGRFGPESVEWNFDLEDAPVKYLGQIPYEKMGDVYRACDWFLYSYYNDACSNCLNEAMMCELNIHDCGGMLSTGGAKEQMVAGPRTSGDMVKEYINIFDTITI